MLTEFTDDGRIVITAEDARDVKKLAKMFGPNVLDFHEYNVRVYSHASGSEDVGVTITLKDR